MAQTPAYGSTALDKLVVTNCRAVFVISTVSAQNVTKKELATNDTVECNDIKFFININN
jgi:hypothetical protein